MDGEIRLLRTRGSCMTAKSARKSEKLPRVRMVQIAEFSPNTPRTRGLVSQISTAALGALRKAEVLSLGNP